MDLKTRWDVNLLEAKQHTLCQGRPCARKVFAPNFVPLKSLEVLRNRAAGGVLTVFTNICPLKELVTPEFSLTQTALERAAEGKGPEPFRGSGMLERPLPRPRQTFVPRG